MRSGIYAILIGFVLYGIAVGFVSIWFRQHTDSVFLLNIPGTLLGDAVYGLSIRFLGDPHSSQVHFTTPWLCKSHGSKSTPIEDKLINKETDSPNYQ